VKRMSARRTPPRSGPFFPEEWTRQAECVGLWELFDAAETDPAALREAQALCAGCPVRASCASLAVGTGVTSGVWAGEARGASPITQPPVHPCSAGLHEFGPDSDNRVWRNRGGGRPPRLRCRECEREALRLSGERRALRARRPDRNQEAA
jgi:hypothetical protein